MQFLKKTYSKPNYCKECIYFIDNLYTKGKKGKCTNPLIDIRVDDADVCDLGKLSEDFLKEVKENIYEKQKGTL